MPNIYSSVVDMFRLLILLFGLCEGQFQSQAVPPILARLPDFIHEFCPGVNICSTNKSITAAAENSCCTGRLGYVFIWAYIYNIFTKIVFPSKLYHTYHFLRK
jgi:hypothetical protein